MTIPRVLIAVPHGGRILGSLLYDLVGEMFSVKSSVQMALADVPGTLGPHNRWLAAKQAVGMDMTHLWLIDNDMRIPLDTLPKLLAADKDIIGAAYNYRTMPITSVVTMLNAKGEIEHLSHAMTPNEPFICHSIGSGCKLVKVDALKKIPQPWFALEWDLEGNLSKTDDRWFCEQAKKAGVDTWCDPTLGVKHVGDHEY